MTLNSVLLDPTGEQTPAHRERVLPLSGHKGAGNRAHLMLDVLIERVSYDPMAIFIVVAVVLLVMLARTL